MSKSHDENDDLFAYRAKWVFPVGQAPIENGIVVCRGDVIQSVSSLSPSATQDHSCSTVFDLGDQAIVPGLINAHTHLEFSDLQKPLGDPNTGFTDWIAAVIAQRKSSATSTSPTENSIENSKDLAIAAGISESLAAGVVAIGEIATTPWGVSAYESELSGVVFHEQLGNNPLEAFAKKNEISAAVNRFDVPRWKAAISPHAPYSTAITLFQTLVAAAAESNTRVAMHLAETLEEVEFIETGAGPFADMLNQMGVPFQRAAGAINVGDYLRTLAQTDALIVHGNYLNVEELEFIAEHKNLNIVFCPRTHAYFGHGEYPLRTMLDLKINVAVGTDSRASNPDLDLFEELKQVAATQTTVSATEILQMGTLAGANALGLTKRMGTIAEDKSAKVCVVSNPQGIKTEQDLFHPDAKCRPVASAIRDL